MKKIKYLLILVITLIIPFSIARAEQDCSNIEYNYNVGYSYFRRESKTYKEYYGAKDHDYLMFYLYNTNVIEKGKPAFCRNPGWMTGAYTDGVPESEKWNFTFKCTRVIFDTFENSESSSNHITSEKLRTYDAGIVKIIKKGFGDLDEKEDFRYVATNVALRIYEILWPEFNSNGSNDHDEYKVFLYYARKWLDENKLDIRSKIKAASGNDYDYLINNIPKVCETLGCCNTSSCNNTLNIHANNGKTSDLLDMAIDLVIKGLDAAIDYKNNGAASIKYNSTPLTEKKASIKDDNGITTYETNVTYTFDVNNFTTSTASVKLFFNCSNCAKYGINYKVYVNDNDETANARAGINILNKYGNGQAKVTINFIGRSNSYSCQNLDYTLKLDYKDDSISTRVYDVYTAAEVYNNNNTYHIQHYYLLDDIGVTQTAEIKNQVAICKPDCYTLERQCDQDGPGSDACRTFREEWPEGCIDCTTEVLNAVCTNDNSNGEIDIKEGYAVNYDTCSYGDKANIKSCIINSKDAAGNSYKDKSLADNKYCSVWCKEDYHLSLPGNVHVNSGRYFSLKASVKGTKYCYTSNIAKSTFESDITVARKAVIDAWNEWNQWNIGKDANSTSWSFTTYDYNGGSHSSSSSAPYSESNLTNATNALNNALNNYVKILNDYNSCAGKNTIKYDASLNTTNNNGWLMGYKYEPVINFWYEESYMNDVIKDTLDTIGNIAKNEVEQKVCAGEINEDYSCKTNWTSEATKETSRQWMCKKSGSTYTCGWEDIVINKAKYVTQKIEASSNYITPTQFYTIYPTGAIVVANEGTNIENGSPLPNGLPVSFSTSKSIRYYALKVKNLGEYYSTDKLGRLLGNDNSVISKLFEDNKVCSSGALTYQANLGNASFKNGVYVCSYIVNCPDCVVSFKCVKTNDGYYGINGTLVTEEEFNQQCCENGVCPPECPDCPTGFKCVKTKDGYYGINGTLVNESTYKEQCCPDGKCPVVCVDCIRDGRENFIYRPITSENINPNDRELGNNWKYNDTIKTGLELKAYATTTEILNNGQSIFDIDFSKNNNDFAIEITMDAKMISYIRDYNDKNKSYLNNTLECYDYTSDDGNTYKNIFCYSKFIDGIYNKSNLKDNIKTTADRPLTKVQRSNYKITDSYWTVWTEAVNTSGSKWNVKTERGIAYYKTNYGKDINIGPAWK